MLVFVDLFKLKVVVAPELGVASSHGIGGFQQVVAKIAVSGFNHPGVLRLKVAGLVLRPDKAGKLGNGSLRIKAVDIADLSDDTGGVDLADTRYRSQSVWNDLKLLFNSLF